MKSAATYRQSTSIHSDLDYERIGNRSGIRIAILLILSLYALSTNASILTFDQVRLVGVVAPTVSANDLEDDYGDRITGSPMNVPGGQFTYGNGGEGFTPNVVIDFIAGNGTALSLWETDFGDLHNVAYAKVAGGSLNFHLSADPGFVVDLYHFDLAGWSLADYTINSVSITDGTNTLFSQDNLLVQGANDGGEMHTSFDFTTPVSASDLFVQINHGNLATGIQDNIGIDNIRFGQTPPAVIPIPPAILLFGTGLLGLIGLVRRFA
ncbi:MAG: hypothetical protein ABW092_01125 [Candidatus Thiodiazotropha sp.]